MVYKWTKTLQSLLFPPTCRLCRAPGLPGLELCPSCRAELPWIKHSCNRCALPLPLDAGITLCFDCINKQPSLDSCSALFAYRAPVDGWIQDLKFAQDLATARLLGSLLVSRKYPYPSGSFNCGTVVWCAYGYPVPVSRQGYRTTGFLAI